jgi:hypothetical protein
LQELLGYFVREATREQHEEEALERKAYLSEDSTHVRSIQRTGAIQKAEARRPSASRIARNLSYCTLWLAPDSSVTQFPPQTE